MGWGHLGRLPHGMRTAKAAAHAARAAAFALAALAPLPAAAQQAQALIGGEILDSTTIGSDADLDFGRIMQSLTAGTVTLTASPSAICTTTGGLVRTGTCQAARFSGFAPVGAGMRVMRPNGNKITLTGPGGATMEVNTFTFGATGTTVYTGNNGANHHFTISAPDGAYTFYVGGRLQVGATQTPGLYTGTMEVRITYN